MPVTHIGAKSVFPLTHLAMDRRQLLQRRSTLRLRLDILDSNRLKRNIRDGIACLINHVCPAVLTNLNGCHNVIQKRLLRHEINHAHNRPPIGFFRVERRRHHDGQLPRNLTDQRLRYKHISLKRLTHILAIGIVFPVKNADTVRGNDISPLETVHLGTLIDDRLLFLHGYIRVGKLRNAPDLYDDILVRRQLLLGTSRRQNRSLAHHLLHRRHGAVIV